MGAWVAGHLGGLQAQPRAPELFPFESPMRGYEAQRRKAPFACFKAGLWMVIRRARSTAVTRALTFEAVPRAENHGFTEAVRELKTSFRRMNRIRIARWPWTQQSSLALRGTRAVGPIELVIVAAPSAGSAFRWPKRLGDDRPPTPCRSGRRRRESLRHLGRTPNRSVAGCYFSRLSRASNKSWIRVAKAGATVGSSRAAAAASWVIVASGEDACSR